MNDSSLTEQQMKEQQVDEVTKIIERALIRHGVPQDKIEGTLDDAIDAISAANRQEEFPFVHNP